MKKNDESISESESFENNISVGMNIFARNAASIMATANIYSKLPNDENLKEKISSESTSQ